MIIDYWVLGPLVSVWLSSLPPGLQMMFVTFAALGTACLVLNTAAESCRLGHCNIARTVSPVCWVP